MKIAIIAAMKPEVDYYLEKINSVTYNKVAHVEIWQGIYAEHHIIICQSGIGKVNAAIATTMIAQYDPAVIINTGSAGALDPDLEIGDIVIADDIIHHDVNVTAFGYQLGQVPSLPLAYVSDATYMPLFKKKLAQSAGKIVTGLVLTGDHFVSNSVDVRRLRADFPTAQCTEMEGAAIAQVCHQFNIPVLVVRAISDTAQNDASILFDEFIEAAGRQSAQVTLSFIAELGGV